jgi:hypothetical protein
MRRVVAAGVVVAAAAVIGMLLLARSTSMPAAAPTVPLAVHVSFEPPSVQFGDAVTAHVVVLLDRDSVRPTTLKLSDDIAPLTQLGPAKTTRLTSGRLTVLSVELSGACLALPCVAHTGETAIRLPRVTASVSTRDGQVLNARGVWPALRVHSRVTAADLAPARPAFRADTAPPAPSYRIAPSTLALLLDVVAALLVAAGVALATYQLVLLERRRRRSAGGGGGELELAIRLARQAESRPEPDRRRALGLLARLLDAREGRLASAASDLAWSRRKPETDAVSDLVGEIEREVAP